MHFKVLCSDISPFLLINSDLMISKRKSLQEGSNSKQLECWQLTCRPF